MGLHDQMAIKAHTMGKKSEEFSDAAQKHANASWFLLIIAGVVWSFSDNWLWALIPLVLMAVTILKSVSSTLIASELEQLNTNEDLQAL